MQVRLSEILSSADLSDIDRLAFILNKVARSPRDTDLAAEAVACMAEHRLSTYVKVDGQWRKDVLMFN